MLNRFTDLSTFKYEVTIAYNWKTGALTFFNGIRVNVYQQQCYNQVKVGSQRWLTC